MPGEADESQAGVGVPAGATEAEARAAEALSVRIAGAIGERPLTRTWRATTADGRPVALVVVRASAPKAERERFGAAAERLRGLKDKPGLMNVQAVSPSGDAYVADLWTTGTAKDLDALRWSVRRRLEFVRAVAQALHSLHEMGTVHGCLCEENILLADDLKPVLAEAGSVSVHALAERGGDAASYAAFAAPEVNEGGEPDARSDVYSLGRLIQHLLRGDEVPEVSAVVRRCVSSAPAGRYASAAEVRVAVDGAIDSLPRAAAIVAPGRAAPGAGAGAGASASASASAGAGAGAGAAAPDSVRKEPGPPARWPAPAGILFIAASVTGAFLGVGANESVRGLLTGALALGVALVAWAIPPQAGTPKALRGAVAFALATLVVGVEPLEYGYRAAAARAIAHGVPDSRRAAIAEIVRLGRDFRGMSLAGADLAGIDLRGADLRGDDLSGSDLSRANLWGALLKGASFDGARLFRADLSQTDFSSAIHVDGAACDAKTLLPDGWRCVAGHPKEGRTAAEPAPAP
jgi:hypothetical protein